jgi:uncharacterized protein (TIGR00730 family)
VTRHRICVFAGSRDGGPDHVAGARAVGASIARRGWGLVYGGASVGSMGVVADAALAAGAEVQGVIPRSMVERELAHAGLTCLWVVDTMHDRKAKMHELSAAFLALPGGCGTLDETFEAVTWMQLGLHDKPIALLDTAGYWQPLARWFDRAVADGFVPEAHARKIVFDGDVERVLDHLAPSRDPASRNPGRGVTARR